MLRPASNQNSHSRLLAPETLAASVGFGVGLTIIARVAGLGRGVLYARWMSAEELGTWALAYNTIAIVSLFLVLGLPSALSRYVERHRRDGNLTWFVVRAFAGASVLAIVCCVAGEIWAEDLAQLCFNDPSRVTLMRLTCLGTLMLVLSNIMQGLFQGLRLSRVNSIFQALQAMAFVGLSVVVFVTWRDDAVGGAVAFLFSSLLMLVVPMWLLVKLLRNEPAATTDSHSTAGWGVWRQVISFSLGSWSAGGLMELWRVMDRWMLVHSHDGDLANRLSAIGSYYVVEMLSLPLFALAMQLTVLVLPHVLHLWEDGRTREAERMIWLTTKLGVLVLIAVSAGMVVFEHLLLVTIFDDHSGQAELIFPYVLVSLVAASMHFLVRSYLVCRERVWLASTGWLVSAVANVVLNLILIPRYQLFGATLGTMISAMLGTATILLVCHREGLKVGFVGWWLWLLPTMLLVPSGVMIALVALLAIFILAGGVFDQEERQRLAGAFFRLVAKFRRTATA